MGDEKGKTRGERPGRKKSGLDRIGAQLPIILGDVTDGITIQDSTGRLIYANAAAARAAGYPSVEAMLAAPPGDFLRHFELLDEQGRPFPLERLPGRRALRGEPGAELTLLVRSRASGEERWSSLKAIPVLDEEGRNVQFAINIFKDITERRRAEDGLRFLLEVNSLLLESLDYGERLVVLAQAVVPRLADWCAVDIVQEDGSVLRLAVAHQDPAKVAWARELQQRYPPSRDAPIGVPHVLRTGESELHREIADELLIAGARDAEHLALLRSVGFRSAIVVPLATRGRILGALTLVTAESPRNYDENDLALAEELARRAATAIDNARLFREVERAREHIELQAAELEEVAAELEAANDELIARTTEAEAANRAKSEFLAMMSHELRTPLNVIAGYVELLDLEIHGPLTETQHEDLRKVQLSQKHLLAIINDVLNFAKIEAGQIHFGITEVALDATLAALHPLIEPQVQAKALDFAYRGGDPAETVRADAEKLQQIMLNLLSNALKFTPASGRIILEWETRDHEIEIRVQDTGRGIPAHQLDAIFEPFFQVDSGLTREVSGVGLGLAISRDLARAMGGELRAESTLGQGSTFFLALPRGVAIRS